jgi:hypothetical protein
MVKFVDIHNKCGLQAFEIILSELREFCLNLTLELTHKFRLTREKKQFVNTLILVLFVK